MKWPLSWLYKGSRRCDGYTSSERLKPPTFPSKGKAFGDRSILHSLPAASDSHTQSSPPWHADRRSARGWRSQTKGESRKRTEESLLSSGRFRLSPATGGRQCRLPVLSAWLLRRTQLSLVLSWAPRKYRFPRSPRPPPSSPYRRFLRLYLAICFIFSCLAASCAARSDSAVSA